MKTKIKTKNSTVLPKVGWAHPVRCLPLRSAETRPHYCRLGSQGCVPTGSRRRSGAASTAGACTEAGQCWKPPRQALSFSGHLASPPLPVVSPLWALLPVGLCPGHLSWRGWCHPSSLLIACIPASLSGSSLISKNVSRIGHFLGSAWLLGSWRSRELPRPGAGSGSPSPTKPCDFGTPCKLNVVS